MTPYVFQKIKEDHLDDVLQIYTHYVLNTTATFHEKALTRDEMHVLVFFQNCRYQTFVALDGKTVCGYVFMTQHKKREAYDATAEVSVYLRPGYEGKGVGGLALKRIEEHARSQGIHVLLATICSQNTSSLRLFERNGFVMAAHYKEVGRKFEQWLDIFVCQKVLN